MHRDVDTRDTLAVQNEVESLYKASFSGANGEFVKRAFETVVQCFSGKYANYQPIDVRYHDLEHTLQGTLCLARLLNGYVKAGEIPPVTPRMFELGLWAILLHDTGYLKLRGDHDGTGAKYTQVHVSRSAEFAARVLQEQGYPPEDVKSVQNMIRCTGVNADLANIPFSSELEKRVGFALGTADLLGQMAAPDYIDKLGILYEEFEESARHQKKPGPFSSFEDLRSKTAGFWQHYVLPKVNHDFLALHRFLSSPPSPQNYYITAVERNIARLKRELETERVS
jgi:hypothetical protein